MAEFIVENINVENGLSGTTFYVDTLSGNSISATTLYGDGSNLTNIIATAVPGGPDTSIQLNSGGVLSGSTNLLYDGTTLSYTGTSEFNGNFQVINSSSAKLKIQWFGTQSPGTAPGIRWINMPAFPTTWLHQTNGTFTGDATYIVDLTEYTQFRFFFSRQVNGTASSNLLVQYSLDNSTWVLTPLTTVSLGNSGSALRDSGWTTIPEAARTFIYIRLIGAGGNGTADPRVSPPIILFR